MERGCPTSGCIREQQRARASRGHADFFAPGSQDREARLCLAERRIERAHQDHAPGPAVKPHGRSPTADQRIRGPVHESPHSPIFFHLEKLGESVVVRTFRQEEEGTTRSTRGTRRASLSCASCASCGSFPFFPVK